ncbi:3-hydroxyacyl-CoA dehydrogenase NAD-binding domain-containing protein [Loktanella sp. Alg231-35]|uniref:3-hydroxyacyl-CoA dehydrogenase NAD-binding domain-containing protein n=1 Tax=Loktanella sp. Alg231-35 TaxID=1922220 RepID=UPI00131EF2B9|nr:3-hydroxyacyl-CoA dehydrogenase NAD-binding domain-containing protein [Loktanella sp. Alg231-35]
MTEVRFETQGAIAIIRICNPPVNAISQAVRQGMLEAVQTFADTPECKAAVLICEGRTFMAGADVKEFGAPPIPPHLPELISEIETCPKPIVAAIHGQALGGGLEIALGCAWRIAVERARFGLPEVTLGVIPGAGGTQRLPRLVGVQSALDIAVGGRPVNAAKALKIGLIDKIIGDLETEAIAFATEIAGTDPASRRLDMAMPGSESASIFETTRTMLGKRKPGQNAPLAAVTAIEAATQLPFDEGMAIERKLFLELRGSPQAAALRHIFFAERASTKVAGIDLKSAGRIERVAVIGAGTMGAGIALFFAGRNIPVTLVEITKEAAEAGLGRIKDNIAQSVLRGKLSDADAEAILERIFLTTDYDDLADTDLVIEAAVENLSIKKKIFAQLDDVCRSDAILATNTSYLDINDLAASTKCPNRIVGLHFFSPAHVMKLVEIVRTDKSDDQVIATLTSEMKKLGKTAVIAGVCHGFIGNRMYQSYQREAGLLLLETGKPEIVDSALRQFGMAMGPFQTLDLSGIDIGYLMRKSLPVDAIHPYAFQVHDRLVEMDRKGRKSKTGFYRYVASKPETDDLVSKLVAQVASEFDITQRDIPPEEIARRCMQALSIEGQKILQEGIADKPGDIDVVFVNGYGFPRHLGGPMYFARN